MKMTKNVMQMVLNTVTTSRRYVLDMINGGSRKNIDTECGHPVTITTEDFLNSYKRGDVSRRIITIYPTECWSRPPMVYETQEDQTPFEEAWNKLQVELNIFSYLQRADILSGVGRFGILLLGIDDGKDMKLAADGIDDFGQPTETAQERKLLYVRPFSEHNVKISTWESRTNNPRFGQPNTYQINFSETEAGLGGVALPVRQIEVHWTRVLHLADNRDDSDVYGTPRLQWVWNRILDLKKVAGGSGEMFWKGGFPGLSVELAQGVDPSTVTFNADQTKEDLQAYMDGLQRYLALTGMSAKSLAIQIADPRPHVEIQIRLIAMAMGIPWRIFMGVEVGQLASEQDMTVWNRRLQNRCNAYISPFILRPLINRLVALGVLPKPAHIDISWADLNAPSDKDRADVADKQTNAMSNYVRNGVDMIMPPFEYYTRILGLTDEEAKAVIDAAGNRIEEELKASRMPEQPAQPGQGNNPGKTQP